MQFVIDVPEENGKYINAEALNIAVNIIIAGFVAELKEKEDYWLNGTGSGEPLGFISNGAKEAQYENQNNE